MKVSNLWRRGNLKIHLTEYSKQQKAKLQQCGNLWQICHYDKALRQINVLLASWVKCFSVCFLIQLKQIKEGYNIIDIMHPTYWPWAVMYSDQKINQGLSVKKLSNGTRYTLQKWKLWYLLHYPLFRQRNTIIIAYCTKSISIVMSFLPEKTPCLLGERKLKHSSAGKQPVV